MRRALVALAVAAVLVAAGWGYQRWQRAQAVGALSDLVFGADVGDAVSGAAIVIGDVIGPAKLWVCEYQRDGAREDVADLRARVETLRANRDALAAEIEQRSRRIADLSAQRAALVARMTAAAERVRAQPVARTLPAEITPAAVNAAVASRLAEYGR